MNGASSGIDSANSADFARAMGQHVASVCVITTAVDGARYGLTATAVSSVCATPPRLLVCVNCSSFAHAKIVGAGHFCVNVLSEEQDSVAKAFAGMLGKDADRFGHGQWSELKTGSPALAGAAAVFDCRIATTIEQFTHTIFIGNVVAVGPRTGQDSPALRFAQISPAAQGVLSLESNVGETLHF